MSNAFMFDNKQVVKAYMKRLKGILIWNFWMLDPMGITSSNACLGRPSTYIRWIFRGDYDTQCCNCGCYIQLIISCAFTPKKREREKKVEALTQY